MCGRELQLYSSINYIHVRCVWKDFTTILLCNYNPFKISVYGNCNFIVWETIDVAFTEKRSLTFYFHSKTKIKLTEMFLCAFQLLLFLKFTTLRDVKGVFYEDYIPKDPMSKYYRTLSASDGRPKVHETISEMGHPSSVFLYKSDLIFITLFIENKILIGNLSNKTVDGFADGTYCTRNEKSLTVCGIVEGPWGITSYNETLYVTQFGSDQVLVFSLCAHNFGWFIDSFGDSEYLDCPEGIAIDPVTKLIYIANYNSHSISLFSLHSHYFIRNFVTHESSMGYLLSPESIVIDHEAKIMAVASFGNNSVLFFSIESGRLLKVLGGYHDKMTGRSNEGYENKYESSDVDTKIENGDAWNSNRNKHGASPGRSDTSLTQGRSPTAVCEPVLSSLDGDYVSTTGSSDTLLPLASCACHLSGPTGIAITGKRTFAVTLYRGQAVVEVDSERGFIGILADRITEKRLMGPTGIAFRLTSFIVASYDNRKVLIFNSSAPVRSSSVLIDSRFLVPSSFSSQRRAGQYM